MPRKKTSEAEVKANTAPVMASAESAKPARKRASTPASSRTTHKHTAAPKSAKPAVDPETLPVVAPAPLTPAIIAGPVSQPVEISHEEIAALAHSYWEARGYQHGFAAEDWLRAEQELRRSKR